jgi:hypothetical protein
MIDILLADLPIGIKSDIKDYLMLKCSDYLIDNQRPYFVATPNNRITKEIIEEGSNPEEAEFLSIFNVIADRLPLFDRIVLHGVCIKHKERSFIISGDRGVGKSFLSSKIVEDEDDFIIINGDKTILRVQDNVIDAYGGPWCGKEGINRNDHAPLCAVILISKGETSFCQLSQNMAFNYLIQQTHLPLEHEMLIQSLLLLERVIKQIPVYSCYAADISTPNMIKQVII